MKYELQKLNFTYDALEPIMDAKTVEVHYSKHHQAYLNNLNNALNGIEIEPMDAQALLKNLDKLPDEIKTTVRNNGGGYFNHTLFWNMLSKNKQEIGKELLTEIEKEFGNFDEFKQKFESAGLKQFGSGWVWLIKNHNSQLQIVTTANQDTPLLIGQPLLCVDLWEHSYYLKYQNKRVDYLKNIWEIVNWKYVEDLFLGKQKTDNIMPVD